MMNRPNRFPNAPTNPYGWNDNNFNRSNVPSNIPFEHAQGGNPQGSFLPRTMATPNGLFSDFGDAFSRRETLIDRRINLNDGNVIHNNIGERVMDEYIAEYRIGIDSLDRDVRVYPDPFDFIVKFAANSSKTMIRTEVLRNGVLETINDVASGTPMPHINRDFKNVKYVKIDNIILPRLGNIIYNEETEEYEYDNNTDLSSDRFTVLSVDELECCRIYSTGDDNIRTDPKTGVNVVPPRPFAIVIRDRYLGFDHFVGIPYYGSKVFNSSALGNINSLSFKFSNSCGVPYKFDNLFTYDDLKRAKKCGHPISLDNIRHPLNKKNQVYISLIIGVVENQINTETKFEK